ncbi:ABC transporter B family member 4 [Apostasia shenzhenica]|uniref:ABC transporter B family member 4 n=1 Tax=Apostasia shenzhenica TaxID=1088818 RepID=A0A2I0AGM4_9ASPA|nr:ABC transporter B family member 4 [Apostasia shenzhenica]
MFFLAIGAGVASFFQVSCWVVTGKRQSARIRSLYLKALLKQEIAFFDTETDAGEVVQRMSGDIILIQEAMGEQVGKFINLICTFFIAFAVAFVKGWLLTLIMVSTIPFMVICGAITATIISKISSHEERVYTQASEIVHQTISSIKTVASFTGEKISVDKYKKALSNAYNSSIYEGLATGFGTGLVMLITYCGYAFGLWNSPNLLLHKGYTGGDVISIIFIVLLGALALGQASPCLTTFAAGQAAAHRTFEIIKRKPGIDAYETRDEHLAHIRGDIEFRDVYFSYPARPDEHIFNGFSIYIHSGTTVALVGESGSGKSTIINLMERFYDPQAGEILIDGVNIKDFQLRWLRGKIGLVSQEPVLFDFSIRENIPYGKDNATIEEIKVAVELANASRFIDMLPQGLETLVGEHGTHLSGGQKQRIALARAILKDPRVLLLDEATSALDVESEQIVQQTLDKVMMNCTTVIVAHRLSTVRNADSIVVISQGSIIERGKHSELVKDPNGTYNQLIRLQDMRRGSEKTYGHENDTSNPSVEGTNFAGQHKSFKDDISKESPTKHGEHNVAIPSNKSNKIPLQRLVYINKPELPVLLLGSIAAISNGLIYPILGIIFSSMIVTFFQPMQKMEKESKFWSLMFLAIGVISLVTTLARSYFFAVAGSKLIRRIRLMTFTKVVNMEMAWFDDPENSSGAIGARLSSDAAKVRSLVGDALALMVENITAISAGLIIAFASCWQISLIIIAMVPFIGLNTWIQTKFIKGFSADAENLLQRVFLDASQVASDAVISIRTVASFSAEEKVVELYNKKCGAAKRLGIRQGIINGIGFGASQLFLYSAYAAITYFGACLVQDGKSTFEKVFRSFYVLVIATIGIFQSKYGASDPSKARSATQSIFELLDRESKIDPSSDSGITLKALEGNITFQHVQFKYPTRPDVQIFVDLCLEVQSGKTIALVGESGSGKSTTIALLQRFYDPDSGKITLDGIELHNFNLKWLRQQMGLVSQEPILFNETIKDNVAYNQHDRKATEAEIISAAESANAHSFISSLNKGYNTMVGPRGIHLSGGQKQRIAIARAILKRPKILLLDEPTSALDAESEQVVQDALEKIMIDRTTIIATHRLTAIKNTDVIVVVKNGMIIEKGTHDKLSKIKDGLYASMIAVHKSKSF